MVYNKLLHHVTISVSPVDMIEHMWVRDLVDLEWDLRRWRRVKAAAMDADRTYDLYERLHAPPGKEAQTRDLVSRWARRQPEAIAEVERILGESGTSSDAILATAIQQPHNRKHFEHLEQMTMQAEVRKNATLREIDRRRDSVARRLRDALDEPEDVPFTQVAI